VAFRLGALFGLRRSEVLALRWDDVDVEAKSLRIDESLVAGSEWEDNDLITATRIGGLVLPRSYDRALATIVDNAGLPRLASYGLRHTAATHMVQGARDVSERCRAGGHLAHRERLARRALVDDPTDLRKHSSHP
jgi:integrase